MKDNKDTPTEEEVEELCVRLNKEAEDSGYHFHPDKDIVKGLLRGILVNQARYGYWACPCRLSSGDKDKDLDIICPCDYREADLDEYGSCYCALYVTQEILDGKRKVESIPERRGVEEGKKPGPGSSVSAAIELSHPVYRCRVCGYLCARDNPPQVCPICKAKKDRFEVFVNAK